MVGLYKKMNSIMFEMYVEEEQEQELWNMLDLGQENLNDEHWDDEWCHREKQLTTMLMN